MIQLFLHFIKRKIPTLIFQWLNKVQWNDRWQSNIHPGVTPRIKQGGSSSYYGGGGVDFKAQSTTPCPVGKEQCPALSMP